MEKGARPASFVDAEADYLIPNDPRSDSTRAQRAKKPRIEVLSERRSNDISGRAFQTDGTVLTKYPGAGVDAVVHDSVTSIGGDALCVCPKLTIHAPAESFAEKYAQENKIPFEAI